MPVSMIAIVWPEPVMPLSQSETAPLLATAFEGRTHGATPPEACAAAFLAMLRRITPAWNGRSVDL